MALRNFVVFNNFLTRIISKVIDSEQTGIDILCVTYWHGSLSTSLSLSLSLSLCLSIGFDKVKLKIHVVKKL